MTRQTQQTDPDPKANLLLEKLDPADYQALLAKGKIVNLKLGRRLYSRDDTVDAVYFPLDCMVCLLATTSGKKPRLELATTSREGVVGAIEALYSHGALEVHIVQISGFALSIPAAAFQFEVASRPLAEKLFNRHMYALTRQILQGAACNHLHDMEERCARWLLVTHDAARGDTFPLTQEFLSHMLGVRRATVNEAVGVLRKSGSISYSRGNVTIRDRGSLEAASCGCYEAVKKVYLSAMDGRVK